VRALLAAAALPLAALAACGSEAPTGEPVVEETEVPEELRGEALPDLPETDVNATPLAQRVATLGLLNKRNNISRDIEIKPGEARRIDDVIIRLASCERTAPWEEPAETGAFVQVLVNERPDADSDAEWRRIFSGWLFKNSPGLNVVEHPVYDVWVKDCAMRFPGEDEAVAPAASDEAAPRRATPAPSASATPAPAPEPVAAPANDT
jgi:hypothetical protein